MKFACFSLLVLVVLFTGLANAQLVKYNDQNFGPGAINLDFGGFQPGSDASSLFARYGVRFSGKDSIPTIMQFVWAPVPVTPIILNVLRNQPTDQSSAGLAFRIDFSNPPRHVGFALHNPDAQAVIKAFDADGNSLGTVEQAAGNSPANVRLSVPVGQAISKLTIDYGQSTTPEEIRSLTLEHKNRPIFETVLPQVADGQLPGGLQLRTAMTIVGLTNSTVTGDIRFYGTDGHSLALQVDSGDPITWKPVTSFSDNLTITSGTAVPAVSGYAKVYTTSPVSAVAAFQITGDNGVVISETSVLSSPARYSHSGPVWEVSPSGMVGGGGLPPTFQTAVAIVNAASLEKNTVRIEVTDQQPVELELQPGEHRAKFIWELFPDLYNRNFQGWLRITSQRPTAAVLIKTKDGLPVSAVPLGSLEP